MSTTDESTPAEREPDDSDADPGEVHPRDERAGSVDGVAEDDTEPGHDPDGDPSELGGS